jgi:hypothetical protein
VSEKRGDTLTKVIVILLVFPVSAIAVSFVVQLPPRLLLGMVLPPSTWLTWTLGVIGGVAGLLAAFQLCRLAWPGARRGQGQRGAQSHEGR